MGSYSYFSTGLGHRKIFEIEKIFFAQINLESSKTYRKSLEFFWIFFSTGLGHRKIFEIEKMFFAQINSESSKTYRKSL